ncbi:hypothetical protein Dimus_012750, partial [Dionaea muscipula]
NPAAVRGIQPPDADNRRACIANHRSSRLQSAARAEAFTCTLHQQRKHNVAHCAGRCVVAAITGASSAVSRNCRAAGNHHTIVAIVASASSYLQRASVRRSLVFFFRSVYS